MSDDDIDDFVTNGFVRLEEAFTAKQAKTAATVLLDLAGIDPDASTWELPVVRVQGSTDPAVVETINTTRLTQAINQLVGESMWQPRSHGFGTFPIRFPSNTDPGDAGWHIDGSFGEPPFYQVNFASQGRALLLLMLYTDVTNQDAPTRIRVGSHIPVARALARIKGDVTFSPQHHAPDALDLPIEYATGKAGTVFLCHPFLVHAATWPHNGTTPRVIAQPCIHHPQGGSQGTFNYTNPRQPPVITAIQNAINT